MFDWLGISALNPALLWGGLAVASPIIIHLLSKRKFKIIDWAAMDFLLDAEKRNRKRVRLEHLILLLLRCLAILLIAAMIARPFFKAEGIGSLVTQTASYERIIILDDSPSMALQSEGKITFDETRKALVDFLRQLARERSGDTFSLYLTSRPEKPLAKGMPLTEQNAEDLITELESRQASDLSARYDLALLEVAESLEERSGKVNHVVYLLTDLRHRDWFKPAKEQALDANGNPIAPGPAAAAASSSSTADASSDHKTDEEPLIEAIKLISEKTQDFLIVDVGREARENLAVVGVTAANKTIVRDVDADFGIQVHNFGAAAEQNVEVTFRPGNAVEVKAVARSVPPGETVTIPLTYRFTEVGAAPVSITVGADPLRPDNTAYFAARVRPGIRLLIVNGDPSSDQEKSETHFVRTLFGGVNEFAVEEVTENQFEALPLAEYQIIFLCNLYRVTDDRLAALDKWLADGGGLGVFLGDQVDDAVYNQQLFRDGAGILPARLEGVRGDETEQQWVGMNIDDPSHPALGQFGQGPLKILFSLVKVFRWWEVTPDKKQMDAGQVSVPVRLTDGPTSPAFVEKRWGKGKVVLATVPVDADWHDWPGTTSMGSFPYAMLALANYLARDTIGEGTMAVGTPLLHELDAAKYLIDGRIVYLKADDSGVAAQEPVGVQAVLTEDNKRMVIEYTDTQSAGFYQLELTTRDGEKGGPLFAANINPTEGDLKRVDKEDLKKKLGDANVTIVEGEATLATASSGAKAEFWRWVLAALVIVLCVEQFLGWQFGRHRG